MYRFHASIHAFSPHARPGPTVELDGEQFATLDVPHETLGAQTMGLSFEEARSALVQLERMFCEPDGSFVWVSPQPEAPWQVDGNLYDRDGRLLFVDVKGTCLPDVFDGLLTALGWPAARFTFQLVRQAIFLDEAEFRRFASRAGQMAE